jgi:hypothetical protein
MVKNAGTIFRTRTRELAAESTEKAVEKTLHSTSPATQQNCFGTAGKSTF